MKGKKVLVTGASGFVGQALALELCEGNEVYALARFRDEGARRLLESKGVICLARDVLREPLDDLPQDLDYVFNNLKDNTSTGTLRGRPSERCWRSTPTSWGG